MNVTELIADIQVSNNFSGTVLVTNEKEVLAELSYGYSNRSDQGVNFHSAFYPEKSIKMVVCSNKSTGAFDIMKAIEDELIVR